MKKVLLAIAVMLLVSTATARSVTMSPSSDQLGTIDRGTSETVTVYISSQGFDSEFYLDPRLNNLRTSSVMREGSPVDRSQYSSQDITSWVEFTKERYLIDPEGRFNVGGETYDGKIEFRIQVPSQAAEPGYHGGSIRPEITTGPSGSGYSASSFGLAVYSFYFKVPGTAYRNLQYDTRVIRTGTDQITVVNRFLNQGTVTTSIDDADFQLKNMNGNYSQSETINGVTVPEGETETVVRRYSSPNISAGNYRVTGTADYITGQASASGTFSLSDIVEVEPGQFQQDESSGPTGNFDNQSLPIWLVVMTLIMVGVLMYSFGIDPIWIIAGVGLLGISMYIIFSPVPNLLLLVLLTATGGLIYYGMM